MAEKSVRTLELSAIELQWLHKSVDTLKNVLTRSRQKEMAGSEIYALRTKEIDALSDLLRKVS